MLTVIEVLVVMVLLIVAGVVVIRRSSERQMEERLVISTCDWLLRGQLRRNTARPHRPPAEARRTVP